MISAAGIKDQELTRIVSMMLIELALLRLSRFKRLALLDTQGSSYWSRCIREFGGRDAREAYVIDLVTMLAHSATYNICLATPRCRSRVESLGVFAASFEDMSMTSPTWRALGQVVLVYFAVAGAAVTAQDTQPGRATFAEMIAFARLASVPCQRLAPDADSFHALALRRLIKPPITEEEIAAKEKDIKRLRVRLGLSRWCKRYAGQMEQARILVQVLRRQN